MSIKNTAKVYIEYVEPQCGSDMEISNDGGWVAAAFAWPEKRLLRKSAFYRCRDGVTYHAERIMAEELRSQGYEVIVDSHLHLGEKAF